MGIQENTNCTECEEVESSCCLNCVKSNEVPGIMEAYLNEIKQEQQDFFNEIRQNMINQVNVTHKGLCGNDIAVPTTLEPIDPNNLAVGKKITMSIPKDEHPIGDVLSFKGTNGAVPAGATGVYLTETFTISNPNPCHKAKAIFDFTPEIHNEGAAHYKIEFRLTNSKNGNSAGDTIIGNADFEDINAQVTFMEVPLDAGETITITYEVKIIENPGNLDLGNTEIGVTIIPSN